MLSRVLRPGLPIDLSLTLWRLGHGASGPTIRVAGDEIWRATRTPDGPGAQHLQTLGASGEILVEAAGPGAEWLLEHAGELVGMHDDPSALVPMHDRIGELHRRHRGLRIGATRAVVEFLVPTILEQKVPGEAARRAYQALVRKLGEPAPGPWGLRSPPDPAALAALPYYEFHPFGIERTRAERIRLACSHAARLEALAFCPPADAARVLRALPGVGPWTIAKVCSVALGDPDAVEVGDYNLAHLVAWALADEPRGNDARMLELLEPYRGQRGRVIRLLEAYGRHAPRYGPRLALQRIARM